MKFNTNKVATAVAAGLGASIVGMSVSQSDQIFFPYIVRSPTVTSVLSVVNIEPNGVSTFAEQLHYVYFHKSGNAATSKTSACIELDFRRSTSPNDIQTFDVGTRFGQDRLGVLFNDPSINNNYLGANLSYSGLAGVALGGEPDQSRAFLLVDNNDRVGGVFPQGSLYGEAIILDFTVGAAWGYIAYNSLVDEALRNDGQIGPSASNVDTNTFSNQFETAGEVINGVAGNHFFHGHPVHLLPNNEFVQRYFVTPVAPSVDIDNDGVLELAAGELGDQRNGIWNSAIRLFIQSDAIGGGVAFDRDENPISGPLVVEVVCVAGVDTENMLLSQGVLNQLEQAGSDGGGWSNIQVNYGSSLIAATDEAIIQRLDFNKGGTFDGVDFVSEGEAFNAAYWLRNGTDRNVKYEALVPNYLYDVPNPNVNAYRIWGCPGIPSQYVGSDFSNGSACGGGANTSLGDPNPAPTPEPVLDAGDVGVLNALDRQL